MVIARWAAKAAAAAVGFASEAGEEVAVVTSELATNLIKHAHGGVLTLTPLSVDGRVGLQLETRDHGPGMASIKEAQTDGFSTVGSLGIGLGTVNRLMDELDIRSQPAHGTHIMCRKWIHVRPPPSQSCPLAFGVATRSQLEHNGDDFVITHWGDQALAGVIDGCGHGQPAHRAARIARHYVETHCDQPLSDIFAGVERACHGTRGVVMALARFDWALNQMTFASVGNIEARVLNSDEIFSFVARRGIIGVNAPRPKPTTHRWVPDNILVLHSDGLSTQWSRVRFAGLLNQPAEVIARKVLHALDKLKDDATVLVVARSATP